jgi:hypothetical protein
MSKEALEFIVFDNVVERIAFLKEKINEYQNELILQEKILDKLMIEKGLKK